MGLPLYRKEPTWLPIGGKPYGSFRGGDGPHDLSSFFVNDQNLDFLDSLIDLKPKYTIGYFQLKI